MATWEICNVNDAFDALLETLQGQVSLVNAQGAKAMEAGDYERAKEVIDIAGEWRAYKEQVQEMRKQMPTLRLGNIKDYPAQNGTTGSFKRRNFGRVRQGQRTQAGKFMGHILQILEQFGGRAATAELFEELRDRLADTLTEIDLQPIPSTPNVIRWQTTAHQARQLLVKSGILKDNSPRGIWELSDEGWKQVRKQSAVDLLKDMENVISEDQNDEDDFDEEESASEVAVLATAPKPHWPGEPRS